MENSYFRSPYNPVRHYHNHDFPPQSPQPQALRSSKAKVVSIPVHFVESVADSNRRHSAAVRIQRHLRGFLVRRKVEAVRRIEAEVDAIESRIQRDLELLVREGKERVRTNEMLMALLLRLDSVRGVRDYRKKVIRRAILLQETVDSLASSATKPEEAGSKPPLEDQETLGKQEEAAMEAPETDRVREHPGEEIPPNQGWETNETLETTTDQEGGALQEVHETTEDHRENQEEIANEEAKKEKGEDQELPGVEVPVKEIGVVDEKASFPMEEDDEWRSMMEKDEKNEKENESEEKNEKENNSEELGLKCVMERMVEENQNLKALVAELCERSSLQCKLMGGLAKRVAQLEKTVQTMERRKKKKKRESE